MLDIFGVHGLILALVALIVIGPKDMPKAMRVLGYWVGRARGVARQFRAGFDEMVREAELAEMEKKWATENERIMREHGAGEEAGEAEAVTVALPAPPADTETDPSGASPPPAEPDGAPETAHRAADYARMREGRSGAAAADAPVMVERPHVAPASAAAPPADPAAS